MNFQTDDGQTVPAVTADQRREVDRIAVEELGLGILQMMENAGRTLALHALEMTPDRAANIVVLAGAGGTGGGGLCCARHLWNRSYRVTVFLDRGLESLRGPAAAQLDILLAAGLAPSALPDAPAALQQAGLVVDALVGYGLQRAPRGDTAHLITLCNQFAPFVLANDVPSGMDATTGETPGAVIRAQRTVTLAAPKTGLQAYQGELHLADIGIPPQVYRRLGIDFVTPFGRRYWVSIHGQGA